MKVFLAAPFTQLLDRRGTFDSDYRSRLSDIHQFLESLGHEVISAHTREHWGNALESPAEALAIDLAGIDACDVLVAFIGTPPSPGVQLEIGYALARRAPVLAIVDRNDSRPYLLDGLPSIAKAEIYVAEHPGEAKAAIKNGLARLSAQDTAAP